MKGRFSIIGKENQPVQEIGCRLKIFRYLLENPKITHGIARSIPGKNEVQVIIEVDGGLSDLQSVLAEIKKLDLPGVSKNPGFTVSALDSGDEVQRLYVPTIERATNSLTMEQLDKSVSKFMEMNKDLSVSMTKFSNFVDENTGLKTSITDMNADLKTSITDMNADLKTSITDMHSDLKSSINALPRRIAEEMSKVINK